MKKYLDLIRYKNLIFIALIQILIRYSVILPILQTYRIEPELSNSLFYLLVIATLFIAAGAYVVNDYFDVKIDNLNKPEKQIVEVFISKKTASSLHQILTGLGIVIGLFLAYQLKSVTLSFVFILIPGLLWFYSASYKRQYLIGNLIIASLAALLILLVGFIELTALLAKYQDLLFDIKIPHKIYAWTGGFAVFSFLLTLAREIVKDMEDLYGDRELECRTLPIVSGIKKTKIIVSLIMFSTLLLSTYFVFSKINFKIDNFTVRYFVFGHLLPIIYFFYLLFKASLPADFNVASKALKFIMLLGLLYSFFFYLILAQNYGITIFKIFQITASV